MPSKTVEIPVPNDRQKDFFTSNVKYTAYGGARGGGKSWALRYKAFLLALRYPGINMLLLRRTYGELAENHLHELQSITQGVATYKGIEKAFTFVNNSRLKFGYCDHEDDVLQYQGQEYDVIFIDEATQFTEYQFEVLAASLRGVNDFPKRFYLTCNPGGIGHSWVKRLFVERKFKSNENPFDYVFIAAKVYDNKALLDKDPGYLKMLENLPPDKRAAWLEGSWDVMEGQFFPEFSISTHASMPFSIPLHWRRYLALDYGLDMTSAHLYAVDENGDAYAYRELHESSLLMSDAAQKVKLLTAGEALDACFAPPDLWNRRQDTGRSVVEAFAESGIYLQKVSNERVTGWGEVKEWLKIRENGEPRLKIFNNCPRLLEAIPNVFHDKKNPNDVASEPHIYTHATDELRYFIAGRPMAASAIQKFETEVQSYDEQINDFLEFGG